MIDLDAIRARDAADMEVLPGLEAYAQHVDDKELRNAIHMVRDRRALLAHVDALAAERDALRQERQAWLTRSKQAGRAIESAEAELAAERKDAERYRWLMGAGGYEDHLPPKDDIDAAMGEKP